MSLHRGSRLKLAYETFKCSQNIRFCVNGESLCCMHGSQESSSRRDGCREQEEGEGEGEKEPPT